MALHARVDRPVAQVLLAAAADGVEAFQRESEGVDALMADRNTWDRCVCFSTSLSNGQAFGGRFVVRQLRHILGGRGKRSPSNTSLIQLPRRIGLVREAPGLLSQRGGLRKNAASRKFLHAIDATPLGTVHSRNAIMLGQRLVQEGVIGVENVESRGGRSETGR